MTESADPPLARVTLDVCQLCLLGEGGECHTPGCAFWMNRAPDIPFGIVDLPEFEPTILVQVSRHNTAHALLFRKEGTFWLCDPDHQVLGDAPLTWAQTKDTAYQAWPSWPCQTCVARASEETAEMRS